MRGYTKKVGVVFVASLEIAAEMVIGSVTNNR